MLFEKKVLTLYHMEIFIATDKLINMTAEIKNNEIAENLLKLFKPVTTDISEISDTVKDIYLLDTSSEFGMISMSKKLTNKDFKQYKNGDKSIGFNDCRIGRFIKSTSEGGYFKTSAEKFVDVWKMQQIKSDFVMDVVYGDDIKYYYSYGRYVDDGTLGSSCMNGHTNFLDIYSKNSSVGMLILRKKSNKNKIYGRSLLWKLSNGESYMDRVYTSDYFLEPIFEYYASNNNIKLKYGRRDGLNERLNVKLDLSKFKKYPYMDTMKYFNRFTGILTNKKPRYFGFLYKELRNVNGN